jgi:hypothetical protein
MGGCVAKATSLHEMAQGEVGERRMGGAGAKNTGRNCGATDGSRSGL